MNPQLTPEDFDWLRKIQAAADANRDPPPVPNEIAGKLCTFGFVTPKTADSSPHGESLMKSAAQILKSKPEQTVVTVTPATPVFDAVKLMQQNSGLTLILALSYSGRWDLTNAIKHIADDLRSGALRREDISEETVSRYLATKDFPDPDLLVRTSGELRISNFLLWQLAYTELYISEEYWPAFRRKNLYAAISEFQKRERRFGMVSEQLQKSQGGRLEYVERFLKSVAKL